MAATNIPGLEAIDDVVVHAPGGKMALEVHWQQGQPATATAVYRCPFERCIDLAKLLRGGFPDNPPADALVFPAAPHAFPLAPELYCHGVQIRPKDDEVRKDTAARQAEAWYPFNHHPHALVTASYKAPEWAFDAASASQFPATQIDPYDPSGPILGCRQRVRVSTSFLVFEGAKFRFQTSGKILETSDGIPANQVEFVLEYPRLWANPTQFLAPYKGRVNSARLFGLGPEKVLFDSFEVDTTWSLTGVECNAVLTFLGNLDVTWNQRLNDAGEPEDVKFVSSSPARPPFQSVDLRAIL